MKKIEQAAQFLEQNRQLFQCPVCGQAFTAVADRALVCPQRHSFDLSRKGTLFMIPHKIKSEYDSAQMWQARRRMLTLGLFDPIVEAIAAQIPNSAQARILDIGSGEGTPLAKLHSLRAKQNDVTVGIDISKSAVNLATLYGDQNFFCVADLAALPFTDQAFNVLMDIFSPAAYQEFKRVLVPGGQICKVIPNGGYLQELRQLLYAEDNVHHNYDNSAVLDLFAQHFPNYTQQRIKYQFAFAPEDFASLLMMTPLNWGASEEIKQRALAHPLQQITVDVTLLNAAN